MEWFNPLKPRLDFSIPSHNDVRLCSKETKEEYFSVVRYFEKTYTHRAKRFHSSRSPVLIAL